MLHDKRKDLDGERQKKLLERLVNELSRTSLDLYYQPTSHIAAMLEQHIQTTDTINAEEKGLLRRLSRRDIAVLLSLNS